MSRTLHGFLGGRIKLLQPSDGYRAGIDPIFLAACLHPKAQERVLDVGAGVGTASLSLAVRCPEVNITCLEIQPEMVELAMENVQANDLTQYIEVLPGDVLAPPEALAPHSFDHVMTNPPYYEHDKSRPSSITTKAHSMTETTDLEEWLKFCFKMLKPAGIFTMIHRPERLGEILACLESANVGDIVIYPLWANAQKPARRVIVQGKKGKRGSLVLLSGMTLHNGSEKYSPAAEDILRHAHPLTFKT